MSFITNLFVTANTIAAVNNTAQDAFGHIENVAHSASMTQILSLFFLGGIFLIGTIWLVWKIIDFRLQPLADVPKNIMDIKVALSKMWSSEQLDAYINSHVGSAIREHEEAFHRCKTGKN